MNPYIILAKKTVEQYIKKGEIITPNENIAKEFLNQKAGVFITIEKNAQLRGCIGTYLATRKNIAEEIIYNAISAATKDNRFLPIEEKELPKLSYTVYVLGELEKVTDIRDLNPQKYGIMIESGIKKGLLLPDLKGIKTIEQQIFFCCEKAGINPEKENSTIYKFEVKKYI